MAKEIRLSEQVINKLHPILSDKQLEGVEDIIIISGRNGYKSSGQSINVAKRALQRPSAHVIMRKNHNKIQSTLYKESLRAFSRLGLNERAYQAWKRPAKIRIKNNGSMIYFTGSDNPDDTKGMIDDKFPIETVTIDEVSEFFRMGFDKGKDEIENIKTTFIRGNDEDKFKMFYMFNPPQNPKAPVMKWLDEKEFIEDEYGNKIKNPKTLVIRTDYRDAPIEWGGKALVNSALEMKRIDEEYYNWLWLGQCTGVKDVIYHMFDESLHVVKYEGQRLVNIGIGVDYGQKNATTYNAFGIDFKNKRLQGIASYRHSGRESRQMKSPSEYANDMIEFINEIEQLTNERVEFIVIDPSATGLAEEIRRLLNANRKQYVSIHKAQNDVSLGISRVQTLIRHGGLILEPSQKGAIEEFGLYAYDEKSIERGEEKPIKDNDHDMDGIRYLVMHMYDKMKMILNIKERER